MSAPATYCSSMPRNQHPAVARWHAHLCGLATAIHEISRLGFDFGFVLRTPTLRVGSQFRTSDFLAQLMISNLQFRFRDLFFDSHELFSRFSFRNPHSSTLTSVTTKLTYCHLNSKMLQRALSHRVPFGKCNRASAFP
jgi:hypothetical protein